MKYIWKLQKGKNKKEYITLLDIHFAVTRERETRDNKKHTN